MNTIPANRLISSTAALLLALTSPWASAQVPPLAKASAVLTSFSYQLQDLDLSDGITPAVSFAAKPDGLAQAAVIVTRSIDGVYQPEIRADRDGAMFASLSANLAAHGGNAEGEVTTSLSGSWAQAAARGGLGSNDTDLTSVWSISQPAETGNYPPGNFTITPNTRILFTGLGEISGELAGQGYASSEVRLYVYGPSLPGSTTGVQSGEASLRHSQSAEGSFAATANLDVSFRNFSNQSLSGRIQLLTDASVTSYQAMMPVPEPSTWASLAAGLVMVGAVLRRRQARAALRA